MKIALCGYGRCGKDTAAEWLARNTILRYKESTSHAAAEIVFNLWGRKHGYRGTKNCWNNRHTHRAEWHDIILEYNKPDGLTLYREMAKENDILNGIRDRDELFACIRAGIVDRVIWIERPGIEPEDQSSMNIRKEDCNLCVINDGTLEAFHLGLAILCSFLAFDEWGHVRLDFFRNSNSGMEIT